MLSEGADLYLGIEELDGGGEDDYFSANSGAKRLLALCTAILERHTAFNFDGLKNLPFFESMEELAGRTSV